MYKCKYKKQKWTKITQALNLPSTWFCSRNLVFLKAFGSMLRGNGSDRPLVDDEGRNSWSLRSEESTAASQHALFTALLLFHRCSWAEKPLQARGNDNPVIKLFVVLYSSFSSKSIQQHSPSFFSGPCHLCVYIYTNLPSFDFHWARNELISVCCLQKHQQH